MGKLIKIVHSPFNPPVEVVDGIIMKLHVPYSNQNVTIQINPFVQDYQQKADTENVKVRQMMFTSPTDETVELPFDFAQNKRKVINIGEDNYEIELLNIGKENIDGQDFPFYEFDVTKK